MIHTTFALLHKAGACTTSYRRLAQGLGGIATYGRDTPISLVQVLDICGLDDALWCLRCVMPEDEGERDRVLWLYAATEAPWRAAFVARETAHKAGTGEAARQRLAAHKAGTWLAARQWQADVLRGMLLAG